MSRSNYTAQDSHPFVQTQQQQIVEEQDVSFHQATSSSYYDEDVAASMKPCLVKPTSKTSTCFMLYSGSSEPEKKGCAIYRICQVDASVKYGTGELSQHLTRKHLNEFEKLQIKTATARSSGNNGGTIHQLFPPAPKSQSDDERKKRFEEAYIAWVYRHYREGVRWNLQVG
jgi:hypothetical protein